MTDFAALRQDMVAARDNLRLEKDHYENVRAIAEMSIPTPGKNAEDRKRELIAGLVEHSAYQTALARLREAELRVDTAQAAIDTAEDVRREYEWRVREQLATALGGNGHEDRAFDRTADIRITRDSTAAYRASLDDLYPTR